MANRKRANSEGSRFLVLTATITALLVALAAVLACQYSRLLAYQYRKQLETVPDDRAADLLTRAAGLGDPGIPVLVESLGSRRESVAAAGKRALSERIDHWKTLPARIYSPKLAILAEELAARVEHFGPTARSEAADLARRILRLWRLDDEVVDPSQVLASCEKVLRITLPQRRLLAERQLLDRLNSIWPNQQDAQAKTERLRDAPFQTSNPLAGLPAVPGGGLPMESIAPTELSPWGGLQLADSGKPPLFRQVGSLPLRQPAAVAEPDVATAMRGSGASEWPSLRPTGLPQSTGEAGGENFDQIRLSEVDVLDLMRQLQSKNPSAVAEARAELVRRGLTNIELRLAESLFDPDHKVRIELARRLPRAGVDAVPWLLRLSRDEHPEVRLSAIAILATTGDPAVLNAIETLVQEDPDPRVRRQARRIRPERAY